MALRWPIEWPQDGHLKLLIFSFASCFFRMSATYKRLTDRANIDFGQLAKAMKAVKVSKRSVLFAAEMFKVYRRPTIRSFVSHA